MKTRVHIEGLDCRTTAAHIEKALEAVPRVDSVAVVPEKNEALVEHHGADEQQLVSAMMAIGYKAQVLQ